MAVFAQEARDEDDFHGFEGDRFGGSSAGADCGGLGAVTSPQYAIRRYAERAACAFSATCSWNYPSWWRYAGGPC